VLKLGQVFEGERVAIAMQSQKAIAGWLVCGLIGLYWVYKLAEPTNIRT
jgi:hypothetical protein